MEHKFMIGQLVRLSRPEKLLFLRGCIAEVVALPGEERGSYNGMKWKRPSEAVGKYLIHAPQYNGGGGRGFVNCAERMLDPIDDNDNRQAEDESKLIFHPGRANQGAMK